MLSANTAALPPLSAPKTDADYLSLLTRKVFHAGFDRAQVDFKWAGFERAFHRFDPAKVAAMDQSDVDRLAHNPDIVRNRAKIRATIANARHFAEVAETHGSWTAWFHSLRDLPYEQRTDTLGACFSHCGPATIYYFLLEAGEATPDDKPDYVS